MLFITAMPKYLLAQFVPAKRLTVGDTVPHIMLKGFLKDSTQQKSLASYYQNHKLLLIDLSATWCVPCVRSWPMYDSLKRIFNGDLEILIVSQEKKKAVMNFFTSQPALSNMHMDFITDNIEMNPVLAYSFLHKMVPQIIWINSYGKVIASTDAERVTKQNIEKAMMFQSITLPTKWDVMDFNLSTYELEDPEPLYKSIITGPKEGINSASVMRPPQNVDEVKLINEILFLNVDLMTLYREAVFPNQTIAHLNKDRMIWEIADSLRERYDYPFFKARSNDKNPNDWFNKNGYCYELKTQIQLPVSNMYTQMLNDLNTYFDLNGHFEKRLLPCWVLKTTNAEKIRTNGETPLITYKGGVASTLKNQSMQKLIYFLNKDVISNQVIDETGIKFNIDIDLTGFSFSTTAETMNNVFRKYSLLLEKDMRYSDVFVISKKDK